MLSLMLTTSLLVTPHGDGRPLQEAIRIEGDRCLEVGRLASRTASWLGRDEVESGIEVTVATRDEAVGFELRRDGELRAERWLDPAPEDCADLHAALGLTIALALDAMVLESLGISLEQPPEPEPESVAGKDDETPMLEARRSEPEPEPVSETQRVRIDLEIDGVAWLGVVPTPAFGGALTLRFGLVEGLDLRAGLRGAGALPIVFDAGRADVALTTAQVGLCPNRVWGRVRASLCAGLSSGVLIARGRGFEQSRAALLPFLAVETGAQLGIRLGERIGVRIGADLIAPALRSTLDVRDETGAETQRREASPVGGAFSLGIFIPLTR